MADESTRIDQWLYETLKADATLTALIGGSTTPRVYTDLAPPGSVYPMVVYQPQSPPADVTGATQATRIMVNGVWAVFAVAETTTWLGDLQDIADRVDTLLHASAGGTADGVTVFTSYRLQVVRLIEERDGRQFRRLGGTYRILAQ